MINKITPTIGAVTWVIVLLYIPKYELFDKKLYVPNKLSPNPKITAITNELVRIVLISSLILVSPAPALSRYCSLPAFDIAFPVCLTFLMDCHCCSPVGLKRKL